MQMTIEGLSKSYGMKTLFSNIAFVINDQDKIGLIGINGTGKSTLLKIIAGQETPDTGKIISGKNMTTEYLSQDPVFHEELTVIDQVLKGDSEVFQTLRRYEEAIESEDMDAVTKWSEEMTRLDAWELESQVKTILTKLSIHNFKQPIKELSGGQKKRLALASALISPCDLLILDEPTNHMDNDTIDWLETYLRGRKGALMMITHDRYFLDRIVDRIIEIDHGGLFTYDGNYTTFLEKKMERIEMAETLERKRENLFRRELAWIRRGAKARSTKQKARIQRFEDIKDSSFVRNDQEVAIDVGFSRLGKKTIELEAITKAYEDHLLFENFSHTVLKEDRIGIIGPNGAGKTTLLNSIIGQVSLTSGKVDLGPTLNIGYFSQEAEEMDTSLRGIEYIKETAEYITAENGHKISASVMMEKFLFDDELQYAPISSMSGGEQRRLYLLKILMMAPNVLILDEPTNDLDIDTLKVLEGYIDDFKGIVITVSHDRYFLDRVCNKIFSFEGQGQVVVYTGNYSDYQAYKAEKLKFVIQEDKNRSTPSSKPGKVKTSKVKMTWQEKKDYETIEDDIAKMEDELEAFDEEIRQNQTDYVKLQELSDQKEALESELLEKMAYYEYLEDLADQINKQKALI